MRFFELFIKNLNLIKLGLYFAGNLSKLGLVDGPRNVSSWSRRAVMDSVIPYFANYSAALVIILNGRYGGPSQAQLFIEGLHSITLELLKIGYSDYFSDLHDEPAGRTVIDTTDRHGLRNPTLGQTSPSSFSSCTTRPPTDRHKHDGPSQAL